MVKPSHSARIPSAPNGSAPRTRSPLIGEGELHDVCGPLPDYTDLATAFLRRRAVAGGVVDLHLDGDGAQRSAIQDRAPGLGHVEHPRLGGVQQIRQSAVTSLTGPSAKLLQRCPVPAEDHGVEVRAFRHQHPLDRVGRVVERVPRLLLAPARVALLLTL